VSCIPHGVCQSGSLTWKNRLHARQFENDSTPATQLLIQAGADLRAKNESGATPLIHAMMKGQTNKDNIRTLICMSKEEEIDEADNKGHTALHHLAKMKSADKIFLKEISEVRLNHMNKNVVFNSALASPWSQHHT
jgi:ankyrin repeat protein